MDELKRRPIPKKVKRKKKKCASRVQMNCQNKKPEQEKMFKKLASQNQPSEDEPCDRRGHGLAVQFARTPQKVFVLG